MPTSILLIKHDFCYKIRAERRSFCDVTDEQASHGSREAADSYYARLRHQFRASSSRNERVLDKLLDGVSLVHQQRRQLLHLPVGEHRIQDRGKQYVQRHIKESTRFTRSGNICAALVHVLSATF